MVAHLEIEPIAFHPAMLDLCDEAIREVAGATSHRMPSGPLHDAAEVSRAGIPTVMMFVQSLGGISHNKIEDTREEHLELCVTAFDRLASKAMDFVAHGAEPQRSRPAALVYVGAQLTWGLCTTEPLRYPCPQHASVGPPERTSRRPLSCSNTARIVLLPIGRTLKFLLIWSDHI